ncbi:MAG: hypothetical protein E7544_01800 [Ruminococcaceae bacterium]|nr:hypothetical protein [Oscillospiraceae bacterium]
MSTDNQNTFNKENLDLYLKELGKEYRKLVGKGMPSEIILIGGAAILANYGFREMTTDVDAVIKAASSMKEAINKVGDKFNLPNGWLNADFMKTASYTPKLSAYSVHYKEFSNVLQVRTVSAEYLIAMKLMAGRKYKNDLSDIVGILAEHEKRNKPITLEMIKTAVTNLYSSWDKLSSDSRDFIEGTMEKGNFEQLYKAVSDEEKKSKETLLEFQHDYPGVTTTENVDSILNNLKKKQSSKDEILRKLKAKNQSESDE